jgi:hypothetical protein
MWGALSDERTGLPFTITGGPRQRSHSWVRVPRDSWPYFTVSDSRLPQPGGPGPRIYIHQQQGGLVIPPGTGFPFRRLLRVAGLRWRYSNPPPRVYWVVAQKRPLFICLSRSHCIAAVVHATLWTGSRNDGRNRNTHVHLHHFGRHLKYKIEFKFILLQVQYFKF